jgi:hypothetical protein
MNENAQITIGGRAALQAKLVPLAFVLSAGACFADEYPIMASSCVNSSTATFSYVDNSLGRDLPFFTEAPAELAQTDDAHWVAILGYCEVELQLALIDKSSDGLSLFKLLVFSGKYSREKIQKIMTFSGHATEIRHFSKTHCACLIDETIGG